MGASQPNRSWAVYIIDTRGLSFDEGQVDRGTMPVARTNAEQSSFLAKLSGYSEIISRQLAKSHWGIPNLLVLTAATSQERLSNIVAKLAGRGSPLFLFKSLDARALALPAPQLLFEPWERAEFPPIAISESE